MALHFPDRRPLAEGMVYFGFGLLTVALFFFAVWDAKKEWFQPRLDSLGRASRLF